MILPLPEAVQIIFSQFFCMPCISLGREDDVFKNFFLSEHTSSVAANIHCFTNSESVKPLPVAAIISATT